MEKGALTAMSLDNKKLISELMSKDTEVNESNGGKVTVLVVISLVSLFAIAGYALFGSAEPVVEKAGVAVTEKLTSPMPIDPPVRDESKYLTESASELSASGYVVARKIATVSSKVMGLIQDVKFEEGMRVTQGEILAQLDSTNIKKKIEIANKKIDIIAAQKKYAEIELKLADIELQKLKKNQFTVELELIQAEFSRQLRVARLKENEANLAHAKAELASLQSLEADYSIRAPFTGVVIEKNAQAGEIVAPSSAGGGFTRTGICTIVDMSSLEVEVDISEAVIGRVRHGQQVSVVLDAYPDQSHQGSVIAIIPAVNRARASIKVRIELDQLSPNILPEMGVKVSFMKTNLSEVEASGLQISSLPVR
ncbi:MULTISPECIES: efflux RND transporter periplasmic adaptor subunit [unclassified Pseudoalteromonas]|uniref:efflux RND transporter periplasmic adaptor subunit n=1 Tax=unclassified Pseudoalteromonas TaxID=194690 RepID=UPI0025B29D6A|nr:MULTISPECIES: efflux RND transporter periplasmic adaptor subunit [unclassified Pseudoalteromonas]MDN3379156.1 efflux RND transporter periplasmic adaptor subunit [Pseudoalteromonas sp. APC 3893]MDN3387651.1 efflux RND transporter periplasmic adaptor subunit [Pseudoalteromonas sp. APC 4017]